MYIKQILLWLLFIIFIKQSTAQQISYDGKLIKEDIFVIKCLDSNKFKVRAYLVCLLDSAMTPYKNLCYDNPSDTLSKSDFNTIIWNRIPNGKFYLHFLNIIYTEINSRNYDEDFKLGNELIISFIKD